MRAWAQAGAAGKAEQQVLQAEKDRFATMTKVDEAALNKLLADDLTYVHTSALLQTKKEFIDSLKSGAIKYVSMTPNEGDWKVRILGNVAIVNGAATVRPIPLPSHAPPPQTGTPRPRQNAASAPS